MTGPCYLARLRYPEASCFSCPGLSYDIGPACSIIFSRPCPCSCPLALCHCRTTLLPHPTQGSLWFLYSRCTISPPESQRLYFFATCSSIISPSPSAPVELAVVTDLLATYILTKPFPLSSLRGLHFESDLGVSPRTTYDPCRQASENLQILHHFRHSL